MTSVSMFSIDPACVRLGAVLARGSPGITLYQADLQLGKHTPKVGQVSGLGPLLRCIELELVWAGCCEAAAHFWSSRYSRELIHGRDASTTASFSCVSAGVPHAWLLQARWGPLHCDEPVS